MSEVECPTCSRGDFASERDMKLHHTAAHGQSISNRAEREFECEWCGDSFTREVNPDDSRRFCSKSCAGKHHHSLQGNQLQDGESARSKVLKRDDATCQRCGCDTGGCKFVKIFATPGWRIPSVCYSHQYEVETGHRKSQQSGEVHHIIPRAAGGPDAVANLVTLCLRCHMEAHREMKHIHESNPDLLDEIREVVCDE